MSTAASAANDITRWPMPLSPSTTATAGAPCWSSSCGRGLMRPSRSQRTYWARRKMPWASEPVRSASIMAAATVVASASGKPQARNASAVKASNALAGMRGGCGSRSARSAADGGMRLVYRHYATGARELYRARKTTDNSCATARNQERREEMSRKLLGIALIACLASGAASGQVIAPQVENVPIPPGVDAFNLSLDEIKKYSSTKNFEILGHSYFRIDQRTPWAKGQGRPGGEVGSGFNTVRVYDGIAYLGGYSLPPTLYHVAIADVRDPKNIQLLSTIPCNPGTRCNYLRVNHAKKILIIGHDDDPRGNPTKPPQGEKSQAGWSFHDVSDPRNPKQLAFIPATPGGKTHGLDIDDRYLYGCGQFSADLNREALQIVDYGDPKNIRQVATWHVPGQLKGEQYGPLNRNNPDGKPQIIQCHEIVYHNDRLYLAWRDAGMLILDVKERTAPKLLATYDYVPPFHGGFLGAAHTSMPVLMRANEHPDIVVHTDEIFDCPQGFGR